MSNIYEDLQKERRDMCSRSLTAFADIYFKKYLQVEMCQFHKELYWMLQRASRERSERIAIAAPRESAKSVIVSLIYIIWSICYKTEGYIMILSDTHDQAVALLSHIKDELENNEKLIEDFPDICGVGERWKEGEIVTRNGVKVTALGAGQKIRGRRNQEARPSLIILDDIENDENTQNPDSREKLFNNWFTKAILKAGSSKTNVIVIGTIQHYDSLLAKLTREGEMPGWNRRKYQSVVTWSTSPHWETWINIFRERESYKSLSGEEGARLFFEDNKEAMLLGTEVLWPAKESYYSLMVMREKEGKWSFDSEKQNEPVSLEECHFNPDTFHYWDAEYKTEEELFRALGDNFDMYGACDPSLGKEGKYTDFSAIITIARHRVTGKLYILDADIRKRKPSELITMIIAFCELRKYKKFVIEANQFQELLATALTEEARQKGVYTAIEPIKNMGTSKEDRILWLEPHINIGTMQFSKKHVTLLEQLRYFPKGRHDDGPDALEMAVKCCQQIPPTNLVIAIPLTGGGDYIREILKDHPELERDYGKTEEEMKNLYPHTYDPNLKYYGKQYDIYDDGESD